MNATDFDLTALLSTINSDNEKAWLHTNMNFEIRGSLQPKVEEKSVTPHCSFVSSI